MKPLKKNIKYGKHLCTKDCLTNLYSLSYMIEQGQEMLEEGIQITALVVDLDSFSQINNTYGHIAGNKLLFQFGEFLLQQTKDMDCMVGRIGADTFIILLKNVILYGEEYLSSSIYSRLQQYEFYADEELEAVKLSCSIGGADSIECPVQDIEELIFQAKKKMQYHKYQYYKEVVNFTKLYPKELPLESSQLLEALAQKDMYTFVHSKYTSVYAQLIAKELGLPEDVIGQIVTAAWIHDIGKLAIPDDILRKKEKLTDYEYSIIKKHVNYGINLLSHQNLTEICMNAIKYHHERWDGNGYPFGIKGVDTPLEGRIMQVADSFSAMKIKRVYRKSLSTDMALEELTRHRDRQFDAQLVDVLVKAIKKN